MAKPLARSGQAPYTPAFRKWIEGIPEKATRSKNSKPGNPPAVTWGWHEWRKIAPLIADHVEKFGRVGLAGVLKKAQEVLPQRHRRSEDSLVVAVTPTALQRRDVLALVRFIQEGEPKAKRPRAVAAAPAAMRAAPKRSNQESNVVPLHAVPELSPAPPPPLAVVPPLSPFPPASPLSPELAAFLAAPVGSLLPLVRALLAEAVQEALGRERDALLAAVRGAVQEQLAAAVPAPAAAPAATADQQQQGSASEVLPLPVVDLPVVELVPLAQQRDQGQQQEPDMEPSDLRTDSSGSQATDSAPTPAPPAPESPAPAPKVKQPARVAAHDLESQMAAAAAALGIPAASRPTVCVVGLHPKVEQELERFYGRHFRFIFKRQDSFMHADDLPPSADALLYARKTLQGLIAAALRRYGIPSRHVSNDSGACMAVLRELFPEQDAPSGHQGQQQQQNGHQLSHARH